MKITDNNLPVSLIRYKYEYNSVNPLRGGRLGLGKLLESLPLEPHDH